MTTRWKCARKRIAALRLCKSDATTTKIFAEMRRPAVKANKVLRMLTRMLTCIVLYPSLLKAPPPGAVPLQMTSHPIVVNLIQGYSPKSTR